MTEKFGSDKLIKNASIENELKESYLIYAISVIISRAIPDVRDGLKPVQRRILYAMYKMGLFNNKKFRKSATVVGSVLGSYHPHGDTSVYESLVRMAQDFSLRYRLVEGQGNFGSVDGDPPAAMRYTETKFSKLGELLLKNIEKNNVDFMPNFDSTKQEPKSLPSTLPLLLLNGASGIAVGLATNILPHNLSETIDACNYFIKNRQCKIVDLLKFIKGPDFPTGSTIISSVQEIINFYETGKGKITLRSKYEIEEDKKIVITEIPYQVNKAETLKKIASLVKEKKLEHIKEIRDESNKNGIRVVLEIKKGVDPEMIIKKIFYLTDFEKSYYANFVALKDGLEPKTFNLKEYFEEFLKYRYSIIERELNYDLTEAKKRLEILEGLKKALDKIDEVIELIKSSNDREDAKNKLMKFLKINENQANAILEMKLERLARLEQGKILQELKEKIELIKKIESILGDPKKMEEIIVKDLEDIKNKFEDQRRTDIKPDLSSSNNSLTEQLENLMEKKKNILILAANNYIKRVDSSTFKTQRRGGMGLMQKVKDNIEVLRIIDVYSTDTLFLLSNKGKLFKTMAYNIPESERLKIAYPISSMIKLEGDEKIIDVFGVESKRPLENKYFLFLTQNGLIKKVSLTKFKLIKQSGVKVIKLEENDKILGFYITESNEEILIATTFGICVRFDIKKIRAQGKASYGVRALKIKKQGDRIKDFMIVSNPKPDSKILVITENGYGKILELGKIRKINRGGKGVIILKINPVKGNLAKITSIVTSIDPQTEKSLIVMTKNGVAIQLNIKDISVLGRNTAGVRIIRLGPNDKVTGIAIF